MPLQQPQFPDLIAGSTLAEILPEACENGDAVTGRLFEDDYFESVSATSAEFSRCVFRRVQFNECDIDRIHFLDCRFESCDFSGFQFREGTMRKCVFSSCRGVGANFRRMSLKDTSFESCLIEYISFVDCRFNAVSFTECDMSHALFHTCAQKSFRFSRCKMPACEIIETYFTGTDLSDCMIDGIRTAIKYLEGTQVSLLQAPVLLSLCGISLNA